MRELLSEYQVLSANRRRRTQQKQDEPERVREQSRYDSYKPNHALIMPQSRGLNAGYPLL
jgi:hypothetical protein